MIKIRLICFAHCVVLIDESVIAFVLKLKPNVLIKLRAFKRAVAHAPHRLIVQRGALFAIKNQQFIELVLRVCKRKFVLLVYVLQEIQILISFLKDLKHVSLYARVVMDALRVGRSLDLIKLFKSDFIHFLLHAINIF